MKSKLDHLKDNIDTIGIKDYKAYEQNHRIYNESISDLMTTDSVPGEPTGLEAIKDLFSWKRGFQTLWTGSPNTGKSTMAMYTMLIKSMLSGSKWCVWSPEMEDSIIYEGKPKKTVKDLIDLLAWTYLGMCPIRHFQDKYNLTPPLKDDLIMAYEFVKKHFYFVDVINRTPKGVLTSFKNVYELHGVDGYLLDPFKSVKQEITGRSDLWLEDVLSSFKEFALETNAFMNYVVHPKNRNLPKDEQGEYRVVIPEDLNGGAAWNNSMDLIISLRRLCGNDPNATAMEWHTLKARKQHLTCKRGSFVNIDFDFKTYRYLWNCVDPIFDRSLSTNVF